MTESNPPHRRKGAGINFVFPTATAAGEGATPEGVEIATSLVAIKPQPRTGVGLLSTVAFEKQVLDERIEALTGEVAQLKTERGAQRIDPRLIVPGRWANRHPDAFGGRAFEEFKREIADASGNVEAIKIRPLGGRRGEGEPKYEVVFGHRRHRACLELGLDVLVVVEELDDASVFVEMERENRGRENLSAYEQGRQYVRALDEGLFPSMRALASKIGRDPSDVSKAMRVARLPEEVIGAFSSPIEILFRWATNLERALAKDADAVLTAARSARQPGQRRKAAEVFAQLTACLHPSGAGVGPSHTLAKELVFSDGQKVRVRVGKGGETTIDFGPGVLPPERWGELETALKRLFK